MHCVYSVTYDDFSDSIKSFRKLSKGAAFSFYFDNLIMPGVGICLILSWLVPYLRGDRGTADTVIYFLFLGPVLSIAPLIFYRLKMRQAFRTRSMLAEGSKVICDFDEMSLRFSIPGKVDVSYPWQSITAFAEEAQVGTVFIEKAAFHTIPKRAMSEADWAVFRCYVQRNVGVV
jgi:hypothetical protein